MQLNVNLTPQLEEMVRTKVASGLYNSASEVVRQALRLMEREDQMHAFALMQLRRDIQDGLDSGPATPLDMNEVRTEGRRLRAQPHAGHDSSQT